MRTTRQRLLVSLLASSIATSLIAEIKPAVAGFTREELKSYFAIQLKLYPKNGDLYQKLLQTFGDHPTYTIYQVTAITDPKKKLPKQYCPEDNEIFCPEKISHRPDEVEVDAFPAQAVEQQLSDYEKAHPEIAKQLTYTSPRTPSDSKGITITVKNLWDAIRMKYGDQPWYLAVEVRDVEENGIKPKEFSQIRLKGDPVREALDESRHTKNASWNDFRSPRIRQNWRDVLYDDDPSQDQNATKVQKDLVGATFSYTNDQKADMESWSAVGALIFPWQHNFPDRVGLMPAKIAIAPSISINRVTNPDPKKEVDSLLYRVGGYEDWVTLDDGTAGIQAREAFVYATDTSHNASLPGGEIDIEPRWQNSVVPFGFTKIVLHKKPLLDDGSDQSRLEYQLRAWLHAEGGDVQDNAKSWDPTTGSFFRLGPTAQLQIRAPKQTLAPPESTVLSSIFGNEWSVTTMYSYLARVSGSNRHNSFLTVSGVYNLVSDDITNHKIGLTLQYQKGGLNLTKEDVDTITLGLSVLY